MRTADEFDAYYQSPDPWGIGNASRRDKAFSRIIEPYVAGKSVLELGCGEGHLTASIFRDARNVKGVDISPIAVERAASLSLPNASFQASDFLNISFIGYDIIGAIECLYYLSSSEQEAFFAKVASEHAGKILILSAPTIGGKYFTHDGLMAKFAKYGMQVVEFHAVSVYRETPMIPHRIAWLIGAIAVRMPFSNLLLDRLMPEFLIYQRCYVARCAESN